MMLNKTFYLLLLSLIPIFGFSQANSQYPDSGNKIRLGFQTSGDGLIWRDTQPKAGGYRPINNKAAWIILDTMNNKFYHYKNSTWILAGGQDIDTANLIATKYNLGFKLSLADTQNMLTPYWRSGRFSGVLPVANGGTGQSTLAAAGINTGSGTLNYLPKYTATGTTLGNSIIFNNGSNVGIGVTPSTWTAGGNNIEIGSAGNIIQAQLDQMTFINNATYNSGWKYSGNGFASFNRQTGGQHQWFTAPSGIAGNPITFTQAMTLDASGNLTVGGAGNPTLTITGSAGAYTGLLYINAAGGGSSKIYGNGGTNPRLILGANNTDALTIASTGAATFSSSVTAQQFTASDGYGLNVGGFQVGGITGNRFYIYNNTLGIDNLTINPSTGITTFARAISGTSATFSSSVGIGTGSPQSGYRLHVVDSVYVGGNVSASAYTTRSDYDLKNEIQNISYGINEVMQMQPVKYTYKSNGSTQLGFIAQDLGVITPEVVSFEDKMSVYYNALIPILTKAIQEQQALIKALEQRIINLENK